jgi:mitochondrial fission protein ELM1
LSLSRYRVAPKPTEAEKSWLDSLPRPHVLMMLGGKTRHWKMRPAFIAERAAELAERAARAGGSLIVARSARTPEKAVDAIERRLEDARCEWRVVRGPLPRFSVLLDDADELFPTFDSVSMISESVISGKPTGIVPAEMNWFGRLILGGQVDPHNRKRDLRRFSNHLLERGLAGMMDHPVASKVANPAIEAAREVRRLLDADSPKDRS